MKNRSKWSRLLAVMLTIVMVLTSSSVAVFADIVGVLYSKSRRIQM